MTDAPKHPDRLRSEAARIAHALLRFESVAAHARSESSSPDTPQVGRDAYLFLPSWRPTPVDEVEAFFGGLRSPAFLAPTTHRGIVALTLLHELSGDRRRWAEKTLSNFALALEEVAAQLGLSPTSRVLLEFDDESHVFSFAGVRTWSQQVAVQVGWNITLLDNDDDADVCMKLMRSDGKPFSGRSCMIPTAWGPPPSESGAT